MCKFKLFSIAAAALMMAACSSDDLTQQTQIKTGEMHFTATIAAPSGTTRTEYTESGNDINVKWVVGDEIALVHNNVKDVAKVKTINSDGSATIEGILTGTPQGNVQLIYPAVLIDDNCGMVQAVFDKRFAQDGTLKYIQDNIDFRQNQGTFSVSGSEATLSSPVKMISQNFIWKLTLQDGDENELKASKVSIMSGDNVIASTVENLTPAASTVILAVPGIKTPTTITIEATVGNEIYAYTKENLTIEPGNYFQSTVKMAKAGWAANEYKEASWDGTKVVLTKKSATNPTAVTSSTSVTWSAGWYTVSGNVTINGNVTLGADTYLILQDGATLTINGRLNCGPLGHSYNLNIYGQEAGTGKLNVSSNSDAIYLSGAYYIKIHGGEITAQSTSKSGIRGGIIEMYAGKLTATTNNNMGNAAISYPNGDFIVYGGEVTAENIITTSGDNNHALSNANTTYALKVFGGKVKATGGNGSKGIKGNIMSGTTGIKFYFSDDGTTWDSGTYYEAATTAPTNRYAKAE